MSATIKPIATQKPVAESHLKALKALEQRRIDPLRHCSASGLTAQLSGQCTSAGAMPATPRHETTQPPTPQTSLSLPLSHSPSVSVLLSFFLSFFLSSFLPSFLSFFRYLFLSLFLSCAALGELPLLLLLLSISLSLSRALSWLPRCQQPRGVQGKGAPLRHLLGSPENSRGLASEALGDNIKIKNPLAFLWFPERKDPWLKNGEASPKNASNPAGRTDTRFMQLAPRLDPWKAVSERLLCSPSTTFLASVEGWSDAQSVYPSLGLA